MNKKIILSIIIAVMTSGFFIGFLQFNGKIFYKYFLEGQGVQSKFFGIENSNSLYWFYQFFRVIVNTFFENLSQYISQDKIIFSLVLVAFFTYLVMKFSNKRFAIKTPSLKIPNYLKIEIKNISMASLIAIFVTYLGFFILVILAISVLYPVIPEYFGYKAGQKQLKIYRNNLCLDRGKMNKCVLIEAPDNSGKRLEGRIIGKNENWFAIVTINQTITMKIPHNFHQTIKTNIENDPE